MSKSNWRWMIATVLACIIATSCRETQPTLTVLNWDSYFGGHVKENFQQSHGVRITERNYGSNEELLGLLDRGRADVVFPSTYTVDILQNEGKLGKLDWSLLENSGAIPEAYRSLPEATSCIPYTWSAIALFYDDTKVKGPVDLSIIFDRNKRRAVAGHIMLLDDRRALLGIALRYLGFSVNTLNRSALDQAVALIREVKRDTLLFAGGLLVDRIAQTPEIWIGLSWSGDARWAAEKRAGLKVEIPVNSIPYVDWACVTKDAREPIATELLDYLLDPKQALDLSQTTRYAPVNQRLPDIATPDVIGIIREWVGAGARMNPEIIKYLGPDGERLYEEAWLRIKS